MSIKGNNTSLFLRFITTMVMSVILFGAVGTSAQASSTSQEASTQVLTTQQEQKIPERALCLIGGGGSAILGFASAGPLGYWGGSCSRFCYFLS
ncbi:hypothetical protein LmYK1_21710 (plasmid) [Ligilactobacillus murinus]|uniref:hypothetical protein n=1 Tax=Ligilactobacillus murinus TaxID=1622 RepID=UPI001433C2C8|nr:hypothetical protein [Ligilactobacillus murinus]BDI02931.1 hypothetical protein LmYK1_21710 [Ligilactobacillus murinus]GFI62902.1 hypothetical protein IMSAG117_00308 [Lactobacillaceae bacterium]